MVDYYGTLAESKTYHAARGNTAWAAGADANLEAALLRASEVLDGRYGNSFPGYRVSGRDQLRAWPRSNATDSEGWAISAATVPDEVKRATWEAALRELATPGSLTPDVTLSTREKSRSESVGPIKESVEYMGGSGSADDVIPILTILDAILARLINTSGLVSTMDRG